MAVIQISKIQVRRGLQENLPQLSSGEFGWSVDTRQLYIGNGTLSEGAPTVGITEIITKYGPDVANILTLQGNVSTIESRLDENNDFITSLIANTSVRSTTLIDNNSLFANIGAGIITQSLGSAIVDYSIIRGSASRVGTIKMTQLTGTAVYEDDYVETAETGVTLAFTPAGSGTTLMQYTTSNTGTDATFSYYLKSFT